MTERSPPRVVVVHAEGPRGLEGLRPAVGIVPFWHRQGLHLGVVCKVALGTRGDGEVSAPFSSPARPVEARLSLDRPGRFPTDGPDQLDYASDFVPRKPCVDVTMVGHAAPARAGADEVVVAVRVLRSDGEPVLERTIAVVPSGAALAAPSVGPVGRPGPRRVAFREDENDDVDEFEACSSAPPALRARRGAVPPDARVALTGAGPGGEAAIDLPGLVPVVTVDTLEGERSVAMSLDTLWIDLDAGRVEAVFRGDTRLQGGHLGFVERVVVSLEHVAAPREPKWRQADTQRGSVGWAATELDGGLEPPAEPEDPILVAARYRTWGSVAPEPRLPLPTYVGIAVELAEHPKRRGDVLARHELSEDRWMIEERAWLELMANRSLAGDPALAATYGKLFEEAQSALGSPDEADVTLRQYAEVRVALERAMDPTEALDAAGWTLARYSRVERRWLARADAERAVAAELATILEELRGAEEAGG